MSKVFALLFVLGHFSLSLTGNALSFNVADDIASINNREDEPQFWLVKNERILRDRLNAHLNEGKAKNIIMFLGDGMSLTTVTAARLLQNHQNKDKENLAFENFPYVGLARTYCVDVQVADSACSSTAYWSGVRANSGMLGVSSQVKKYDCDKIDNTTSVQTMALWSQLAGKSTGIVTTTTVTHASPGGSYARAYRHFESDADVIKHKQDPKKCTDIATQLVKEEPGKNFNVILGGGRQNFRPRLHKGEDGGKGKRKGREDLISRWIKDKEAKGNSLYVWNRDQLLKANLSSTDYLMGLFSDDHMHYNVEGWDQPTLAEMTKAAINVLQRNEKGFMLFVEGGLIDMGHHKTRAQWAIDETIQFSAAVEEAYKMTSPEDTLIVVTSDHSHTMTISGYPNRGRDVTQLGGISSVDQLPYTILSYANGPNTKRENMADMEIGRDFQYPATVPMSSETHGGEDVAVFASGPWAHLFSGSYEQTFIPIGMMYAACIGPYSTACDGGSLSNINGTSDRLQYVKAVQ